MAKPKVEKPPKTGEQILVNAAKHLIASRGLKFESEPLEAMGEADFFLDDESKLVTQSERELFLTLRTIVSVINDRILPATNQDIVAAIDEVLSRDDMDEETSDAVTEYFLRARRAKMQFVTVPIASTLPPPAPQPGLLKRILHFFLTCKTRT